MPALFVLFLQALPSPSPSQDGTSTQGSRSHLLTFTQRYDGLPEPMSHESQKVAALLAKYHAPLGHLAFLFLRISLPHSCARHEAFEIVESQGRYGPVLSSKLPRPPEIPKLPIIGSFLNRPAEPVDPGPAKHARQVHSPAFEPTPTYLSSASCQTSPQSRGRHLHSNPFLP